MGWNEFRYDSRGHKRVTAAGIFVISLLLSACSVTGPRESPVVEITEGSPTVLDIYRGQANAESSEQAESPRNRMRRAVSPRPIAAGDENTQRYWSAVQPMRQRFARVPNPDLVMVVYPHLAKGKYPVPGYVTVFPMYEETHYALPGEVAEDLLAGNAPPGAEQTREASRANARGAATENAQVPWGFEN